MTAIAGISGLWLAHALATLVALALRALCLWQDDPLDPPLCPDIGRVSGAIGDLFIQPLWGVRPIRDALTAHTDYGFLAANSLIWAVASYGLLLLAGRVRTCWRAQLAEGDEAA